MTKRALVIDDDEIALELSASLLRQGGYEVLEMSSPLGASRLLLSQQIDVVVLDLFMPQMDGDRFVTLLQHNPKLRDTRLVLISGDLAELEDVFKRVGAHAIVPKARLRSHLLSTVNRCLRSPSPTR